MFAVYHAGIVFGDFNFHGNRKSANSNDDVDGSINVAHNFVIGFHFPDRKYAKNIAMALCFNAAKIFHYYFEKHNA
jgi:hypothetical protein